MTFPSKMPAGRSLFASAVLLEAGVLGLFVSLLLRSAWVQLFAIVIVSGLAAFAAHVIWMLRSPVTKPIGAPRIDFAVLHAASSGLSLVIAVGIGLTLVVAPSSASTLRLAAAYGVFGLVGFLAQMVVAMETRLLPLFTWFWAYAHREFRTPPTPPLAMRDRTLQTIVFAGWTAGVPALAGGFLLESSSLLAAGGWSLLVAVTIGAIDHVFVTWSVHIVFNVSTGHVA